ncbi:sigma-70 family RNA polymerase sigma factor [Dyadobacter frigoris]|uniref:Sigma-70 family RNA polymerase sigma factor n=1 Tax=Dyadobacter frigoris TaxID=2576211 RepID=A0A4U6D7W6_9BACT|nr:sigma-70 family RNA polymerase sigma factor [Dyadobacter frigoris]TKT92327.1 sigma-70 family RNA polymerase sigma factor [Dyadobacter frigoris]GLU53512.1 putative RNA polymerase sigma factor [Dyadobacter frigoris]
MLIDKNKSASGNEHIDPRQWVKKYADYLYTYAVTRINDEEQARDLVQETFLAALEKVKNFEGRSSESTWLTAILKNKIIDIYRKKSSGLLKKTDVADAETAQKDFFDPDDGHWNEEFRPREIGVEEDLLVSAEFSIIFQKCMEKLPALWSSVFAMKHMDEELTENICEALKITPSNFWVIIHRAKLNLRACLQKNWI